MARMTACLPALILLAAAATGASAAAPAPLAIERAEFRIAYEVPAETLSIDADLHAPAPPPASSRITLPLAEGLVVLRASFGDTALTAEAPATPGAPWILVASAPLRGEGPLALSLRGPVPPTSSQRGARDALVLDLPGGILPGDASSLREARVTLALPDGWHAASHVEAQSTPGAEPVFETRQSPARLVIAAGPWTPSGRAPRAHVLDASAAGSVSPAADGTSSLAIALRASRIAEALARFDRAHRSLTLVALPASFPPLRLPGLVSITPAQSGLDPAVRRALAEAVCAGTLAPSPRDGDAPWLPALCAYLVTHTAGVLDDSSPRAAREEFLRTAARLAALDATHALATLDPRASDDARALATAKGAMLFHALRLRAGESAFAAGVATLAGQGGGWDALAPAFSLAAQDDLSWLVTPWLTTPGAPSLSLATVRFVSAAEGGGRVVAEAALDPPWPLPLGLRVTDDRGRLVDARTWAQGGPAALGATLREGRAVLVELDPDRDAYRRFETSERPALLGDAALQPFDLVVLGTGRGTGFAQRARVLAPAFPGVAASTPRRLDTDLDAAALAAAPRVLLLGRPREGFLELLAAEPPPWQRQGDDALAIGAVQSRAPDAAFAAALRRAGPPHALAIVADALAASSLEPLARQLDLASDATWLIAEGERVLATGAQARIASTLLRSEDSFDE